MKKHLIFLLVLIIAVTAIPYSANAANTPVLEMVAPHSAHPGDEISVDVVIKDNPGIMVIILDLDYDRTCLEFTGFSDGIFKGWEIPVNAVWVGDDDNDADGTILTLKFKVRDSAVSCTTEIAVICKEGNAANYNEEIIRPEIIPCNVEILADEQSDKTKPDETDTPGAETEVEEDSQEDIPSDAGSDETVEPEETDPEYTEPENAVKEEKEPEPEKTETEETETQPAPRPAETSMEKRMMAIVIVSVVIAIAIIAVLVRNRRSKC